MKAEGRGVPEREKKVLAWEKNVVVAEQLALQEKCGAVHFYLAVIAGVSSGDAEKRGGMGGEDGGAAWKRIVFSAGGRIA